MNSKVSKKRTRESLPRKIGFLPILWPGAALVLSLVTAHFGTIQEAFIFLFTFCVLWSVGCVFDRWRCANLEEILDEYQKIFSNTSCLVEEMADLNRENIWVVSECLEELREVCDQVQHEEAMRRLDYLIVSLKRYPPPRKWGGDPHKFLQSLEKKEQERT